MKKWIFILAILILIIAISGCTSNQTPPENKTYSANGLSFVYPGNWEELDKATYQSILGDRGELLVLVGDGSSSGFGIAKINNIPGKKATLNDLVANYNSTLKSNGTEYVSEGSIIIYGVKGYEITVKASENYFSSVLFIKNNTNYLAIYESQNNDQEKFNQIISTLKVP